MKEPQSLAGSLPQFPQPSPEAQAAYDRRWQRVMDCVALRQPDRMPVLFHTNLWLAKYGGMSIKQGMYDYELAATAIERACLEFEPDLMSPQMKMGSVKNRVGYRA